MHQPEEERDAVQVLEGISPAVAAEGRPKKGNGNEMASNRQKDMELSMLTLHLLQIVAMAFALCASGAFAQTAREIRGSAGVVPLVSEPPAKIIIDPPVADSLALGRVVIQYQAENLRIVQVFGPAALDVSPRIGHIHVTVDDAPWRCADASGEPLIINGLPAGPHKILIEHVNANHQTLDQGVVNFVIPQAK